MSADLITVAAELLLVAVFVGALVSTSRTHDPVGREVLLIFGALAPVVAVDWLGRILGPVPTLVALPMFSLLFAQPLFVMRLVSRLRDLPRRLLPGIVVVFLLSLVPVVGLALGGPAALGLITIGTFVVLETIAAGYLASVARLRHGAARARIALAALATFGFALAFFVAATVTGSSPTGQLILLCGAAAYVVAFLPPARLRRLWSATEALRYSRSLSRVSATEPASSLWGRLANTARELSGADCVIVEGGPGEPRHVVASTVTAASTLAAHATADADVEIAALVAQTHATVVQAIPISIESGRPATLTLLGRHASLFGQDDVALLQTIGEQTALLVERRVVLARQQDLTQQLSVSLDALRAASQAKSDFLASMSHELRTPLSAIIGFSELIQSEPAVDGIKPAPSEWVDHIHRGGEHLLALINDVLDLSKVEAGRLEFTPEPVRLDQSIAEILGGVLPLAERKHIALSQSAQPFVLVTDRGRLRQILYNLLSNAIKYTGDGGRVAIAVSQRDEHLRISVTDTGVGIAPEDQPLVFDEFTQVGDMLVRQEGTGLGLALTKRLVEAQGGKIELESAPGVGSTFTVVFPMNGSSTGHSEHPAAGPTMPGSVFGDVLVVEDDPAAVRLLRAYLDAEGIPMRATNTAELALAAARERAPNAIILDVLLPGIDGWDLLRTLKADPALRDIPVIMVTVVDEREIGLALGAVDYFLKPVGRDALIARLSRYTFVTKSPEERLHVLAIDDEATALDLIEAALQPEGFFVARALSGRQGLAAAQATPPDLVICDLIMPELDGFGVIAALKADARTRAVPILVLTAHDLTETEKALLNGQILGVVGKGPDAVAGLRAWLADVAPPSVVTSN